jgi:hypothetical protein
VVVLADVDGVEAVADEPAVVLVVEEAEPADGAVDLDDEVV